MPKNSIYSCSDDVLESKIDEEIVLMSLNAGQYFGLDEVASRIWELLSASPMTLSTLCEQLMTEYDIDEASCQEDTHSFLTVLVEKGLLIELDSIA